MAEKRPDQNNSYVVGNAVDEGQQENQRGWFVGHFIPNDCGLRCTPDVEIKWGIHPGNEKKPAASSNGESTTLTLLISGLFLISFPELGATITLEREGDYVVSAPGVLHGWKAIKDSVVLTVRWPSVINDKADVRDKEA
ncbi:MAG TPA: signal peptidase I [Blastocatellia bacterium]|nr:signal peptidase I [Blastocatellia bacterium]